VVLGRDQAAVKSGHALLRWRAAIAKRGCLSEAEIDLLPTGILLRNASVLMHLIGRFLANLSPYVDVAHWVSSHAAH
jgi:hypothetical protein